MYKKGPFGSFFSLRVMGALKQNYLPYVSSFLDDYDFFENKNYEIIKKILQNYVNSEQTNNKNIEKSRQNS